MDKNAIKKYAVWARTELITRVSQRAEKYDITAEADVNATSVNGVLLSDAEKKQRKALIEQVKQKGLEQVMEEVAYTWFNRFIALRFMEVNGYLPSHIRVFTDDNNEFKPQILSEAIHLELDGLDMEKVYEMKNNNENDELYKYLIITQCNELSKILPGMFQKISDYTELLFPDYLLRERSVIEQLVKLIPENDWLETVEIIGWMYQFYNIEPKAAVDKKVKNNKKVAKEELPAKTQLFTPDWIVKYLVENSLGRFWIEGHKNDELKSKWKYYDDKSEAVNGNDSFDDYRNAFSKVAPEEIKCIDPCAGSGHICAYMFDVLVQIYESYGYGVHEAVASIVKNNIFGLDIDDRSTQLTYFVVMMKARQYDRRFFNRGIQPNIYSIQESNGIDKGGIDYFVNGKNTLKKNFDVIYSAFIDAKEYGSLINIDGVDFDELFNRINEIEEDINIYRDCALNVIKPLITVAFILQQKYEVVVTNPPYLGAGDTSDKLLKYIKKNYMPGRTDMFAVFIKKCCNMTIKHGFFAMITMQAWMFQSSFLEIRELLLQQQLVALLHLGAHAFEEISGEIVQTAAFSFFKGKIDDYKAGCFDLSLYDNSQLKEEYFLKRTAPYYLCSNEEFSKLPGLQYSYWISDAVQKVFTEAKPLAELGIARRGLQTGDAPLFIRYWYEIDFNRLTLPEKFVDPNTTDWVIENNGGSVRKWYGSIVNAVPWKNNGQDIKNCKSAIIPSEELYFKKCITWNKLTTKGIGMKLQVPGMIQGDLSPFFIPNDDTKFKYCFGLLNSTVASYMMRVLNPTITTPTGDVSKLPVIVDFSKISEIERLVDENVAISKQDSMESELSWEFEYHPLIGKGLIKDLLDRWNTVRNQRRSQLKNNEERLNQIFIDIYGLQDELSNEVDDDSITLQIPDVKEDIKSLCSYIVGCLFGRYSIEQKGVVVAGENDRSHLPALADKDNIIPICSDEYFEDDIVGLFVEFVKKIYGDQYLEDNLKYIGNALGGKLSSRGNIRKYFLDSFYKDHCKVYKKCPIYWLFDSGKNNGFKCLIYMHRYQADTVARIRTNYVHELQARYRTAIEEYEQKSFSLNGTEKINNDKHLRELKEQDSELHEYEERIHHLADQMIKIDLQYGVKKNYLKLKDVLAEIK